MASPARQPSPPEKTKRRIKRERLLALWIRGPALLLVVAGWIWHALLILGVACTLVSLVLEYYLTRDPGSKR